MKQVSELTNKEYEIEDVYFFKNFQQVAKYIEWQGCSGDVIEDLFVDGSGKLVFVINKFIHEKFKNTWGKKDEKLR